MGYHKDRCRAKRRYRNQQRAQAVLERIRRQGKGGRQRAYRCCFCGGWHLGSSPSMETLEQIAAEVRGLDREEQHE